jgi:hypothetical protein
MLKRFEKPIRIIQPILKNFYDPLFKMLIRTHVVVWIFIDFKTSPLSKAIKIKSRHLMHGSIAWRW